MTDSEKNSILSTPPPLSDIEIVQNDLLAKKEMDEVTISVLFNSLLTTQSSLNSTQTLLEETRQQLSQALLDIETLKNPTP